MTRKDEKPILEGIASGDSTVLKAFYQRNLGAIQHHVLQNSGHTEDAEDVFQDALVFLYQKLQEDSFEIQCSIHTYFYAICKNIWRNRLRKKYRIVSREALLETEDVLTPTVLESLQEQERKQLFQAYFFKLTIKCREILALVFEGKSMREISKITRFSEGYARKKKFDCKKKLLEMLESSPSYQELKNASSK